MKNFPVYMALASAVSASPAMAQGGDSPFTGPRAEVLMGYDISKAGSSVDDDVNVDNDQSIDGFLYGIGAGYDYDLGKVVIGAEAELTDSTAKTSFENGDFEGFGFGNVKTNRDLYLGARFGAKVTSETLLYVKGGYTNAKFDVRSNDGTTELSQDIDVDGWRAGAGVERLLGEKAFVKLEYRYSNYQNGEIDFGGDLPDSERFDVDVDRHQIVAGVGVRF